MISVFFASALYLANSDSASDSTSHSVTEPPQAKVLTLKDSASIDLSENPDAPKTIDMKDRIGEYLLYWKTLYSAYVGNDEVSVFELPNGYSIESIALGNKKLFSAEQTRNRVVIKKLAFDDVATTLVILVGTPFGDVQSVAIDLKSAKVQKTTTSIARFVIPVDRNANRAVESIKVKYLGQMDQKLKAQEVTLNEAIWKTVIEELEVFRIPEKLSSSTEKYKGADFRIDAVVNSRNEGFIYTSTTATDAEQRECRITELKEVVSSDKLVRKRVELFATKSSPDSKRIYQIYRTSRMSAGEWSFKGVIWSEKMEIELDLQYGDAQ